jgi:hypothetical protein
MVAIYRVKLDTVTGTGIDAIAGNPDIPAFGTQFDPVTYPYLVVTSYSPSKLENSPNYIDVTVNYSTPKTNDDATQFPPTLRPTRRSGNTTTTEQPILVDASGLPIFMSNGRPPSRPVTRPKPVTKNVLTKWRDSTFTFADVGPFVGKINSAVFDGAAAGQLLLSGVSWRGEYMSDGAGGIALYYEVNYEFDFNENGFNDEEYVSNDIYELLEYPTGSGFMRLFRVRDEAGREVSQPYFLDDNGKAITPTALIGGAIPHTFAPERFFQIDFAGLGTF